MKVYFERSGGFVGRTITLCVDTKELPPEKALRLLELVEDTDFFALPEPEVSGQESMPMPDQICYRVTVEVAGVQQTIETPDPSVPPGLEPLIDELSRWARQSAAENPPAGNGRSGPVTGSN